MGAALELFPGVATQFLLPPGDTASMRGLDGTVSPLGWQFLARSAARSPAVHALATTSEGIYVAGDIQSVGSPSR